jgi:hypothetical protein
MTHSLQRITTEYDEVEDRIRLSGDVEGGAPVVIWLTQRLLLRIVPMLLRWLEGQHGEARADMGHAALLHGFAQEAARAGLMPQAPVRAQEGSLVWLVRSVNVVQSNETLGLTFRGADALAQRHAGLTLSATQLRQWLAILHDIWRKAEWAPDVWPVWLSDGAQFGDQAVGVLH